LPQVKTLETSRLVAFLKVYFVQYYNFIYLVTTFPWNLASKSSACSCSFNHYHLGNFRKELLIQELAKNQFLIISNLAVNFFLLFSGCEFESFLFFAPIQ